MGVLATIMPEASGRVITAPTCADLARNLATLAQVKSKQLLKGRISPYIVPPLPVPSAAAISPDAKDRHHDRGALAPSEMTGGGGGGGRGDSVVGGLRARSITEGVFCVCICGRWHVCMYESVCLGVYRRCGVLLLVFMLKSMWMMSVYWF